MGKPVLVDLEMTGGATVTGLPTPANPSDAVPRSYVDAAMSQTNWKDSARVSSVANINLAGPGAAIDGVIMANGDRVLVKDQTAAAQNGVYVFNGAAAAMTRASDTDSADELEMATVRVEEGTNAGGKFYQTAVNFTLGTDDVVWVSDISSAPAASETTAGISERATQAEVNAGTDDSRHITPLKLANSSLLLKKASGNLGDGSSTLFNVDHNFGTRDVQVGVYRNSGDFDEVLANITRPSDNRVTIGFTVAPAVDAFRVVVIG